MPAHSLLIQPHFNETNPQYTGCNQESGFTKPADGNNHLSGFSYDLSGNTQGDGVNSYTWDAESQLKSGGGVNYVYDGDGRRLSKVGSKLYWYGSGAEILAETDASGNTIAEYIFFGGKRIAMLPVGSTPIYYVEDLLGTSRVMTTNAGVVCYDADFYPFGGERPPYTNTCPQNSYKFEGKVRDTETLNDDFGARSYSNRFGRWLSADWSAIPEPVPYADLANPQTLNLYSMVADDPESFADLDGHDRDMPKHDIYCGFFCRIKLIFSEKPKKVPAPRGSGGGASIYNAVAVFFNFSQKLGFVASGHRNLLQNRMPYMTPTNKEDAEVMDKVDLAILFIPGFDEAVAAERVTSLIGTDTELIRLAEQAGKSNQAGLDRLFEQLMNGNLNPGIGTKSLGRGIWYARSRDGARLFFRVVNREIQVLGKATKHNEAQVIRRILELF
jgi:RHS repeat-associated protein